MHRTTKSVLAATSEYRDEQDVLGDFLADRCFEHRDAIVRSGNLYKTYQKWAEENGQHQLSQTDLGTALGDRGFTKTRISGGTRAWRGVGLVSGDAGDDDGDSGIHRQYTRHRDSMAESASPASPVSPEGPSTDDLAGMGSEGDEGAKADGIPF